MIDLWHLTNIDWLRQIGQQEAERLRQSAELRTFAAGDQIFGPDPRPDKVFILESGLIRIFRESPNAHTVTFGFIKPGEIFGESALFDNQPRQSQATAVQPSSVLILLRDVFVQTISHAPEVYASLMRQIDGRFRRIETRVEDLVFRTARGRLARVLIQLAEEFGVQEDGHTVLPLLLTHEELAALIGTSRPTASLAMGELEQSALIARHGKCISIPDIGSLARSLKES